MTNVAENPSSGPAPRRGKKLLFVLGGLLAVLVLLVVLTPTITDAVVRPKVVAALRDALNGEPAVGRLSFSLFSGLELADLRIGNPPGFSSAPCVTVERVTADPSLLSLLGGKLVFNDGLRVVKPQVFIEQDARGRLNVACLAKEQKPAAPVAVVAAAAPPESKPAADMVAAAPFVIASLLVEDLGISVKTPALPQPVALSPLRIKTRVNTLDKPVEFFIKNADASLDVKGRVLAARDGKLDLANLKAELDYAITPALLAPLMPALGSLGPLKRFEGTLAGAGHFALDGMAKPSGKGRITLDLPQVALELAAGGTNVVQTFRPGTIQFAYDFKARDARQTDLDWQFASPAASVAMRGVATADPAAPALEGDVMVTADIAALGERFPGVIAAGRKLQGRIAGGIKNLKASAKTVAGDLDIRGEGLAEIGPGGAVTPLVRDLAVRLRLAADVEKNNYSVEDLVARVDDALSAKGRLRIEKKAAGSVFEADLQAGADLDALMARARRFTDLIPPTLPLAGRVDAHLVVPPETSGQAGTPLNLQVEINGLKTTGIQIPYGEMDLTGIGSPGWAKFEARSFSMMARALPAIAPAGQQPLEIKATGRATADLDAGRYDVPELRVSLPGAGLAAAAAVMLPPKGGDLGAAQVKAAANAVGDIQSLFTLARIWGVSLDGMTGRGNIAAQLETDGTLAQFAVKKLHAEVKEFAMSGPKAPQAIRWPQSLACDAVLTLNALDPMKTPVEIISGTAQVAGVSVTSLKGRLALDPKSDQSDLQIAGSVDPAVLAAALPGYLNDVTVTSAPGPFEARLRGSAMGARTEITAKLDLPETALKPPKLAGGPIRLGKPSFDVQATLDTTTSAYRITRASLKTVLANLDAQGNVALDAQGKLATLDGRLDGAADLTTLGAVAVAVGSLAEGTELAGNLKVVAEVKAAGGAFPYTATLTGQGVRFKGQQTKGIAIDEPEPVVKIAGTFANTKDGFTVSIAPGSELRAQTARGTLSGTIRSQANQPLSAENLVADLTYDPARLKPLLAAFDAGEIRGAGPQAASVAFSGPLSPGANTLAWLGGISLAAKLGYGSYAYTDVIVEGPPLALEMKGGRLPVDYACKINGGATTLKGNVDANQRTQLALSAKDVGLTLGLMRFLGFLNSIINVEKGSIQGAASLDAVAAYEGPLPLPTPPNLTDLLAARLAGRGTYSAKNLRVQGSQMLNDIINFVGQPGADTAGDIQPTNFVIERGEFRMDKAVMHLNGLELTLAGIVRFDQTLDMQVGVPMPKRIRDANATVAQYLPAAVTVPVRGRVGATQVDYSAAATAALRDAGTNALKGQAGEALKSKAGDLLKGKAGDLLKGFLGGGNK
ncbi:MAG: hypothetical protein HZC54_08480 [Verrucomicrobia bacterium]|nr:hypothetical protein [Verrucomicrobiota bacterium]